MSILPYLVSLLLLSPLLSATSIVARDVAPRIKPRIPQFKGGDPKGITPLAPKLGGNPAIAGPGGPGGLAAAVGGLLGGLLSGAEQTAAATVPYLIVVTTTDLVYCRKYPDSISPDPSKLHVYTTPTRVVVNCWTNPSIKGWSGSVQGDAIWLRTSTGCYIPEMNVQNSTDFQAMLKFCQPPEHWVGTLQTQYKRQDCYECTNTNCKSQNLGNGSQIDIDCYTSGEVTGGNSTWVKAKDQSCYFPGAIFNPRGYLGTPGKKCPG